MHQILQSPWEYLPRVCLCDFKCDGLSLWPSLLSLMSVTTTTITTLRLVSHSLHHVKERLWLVEGVFLQSKPTLDVKWLLGRTERNKLFRLDNGIIYISYTQPAPEITCVKTRSCILFQLTNFVASLPPPQKKKQKFSFAAKSLVWAAKPHLRDMKVPTWSLFWSDIFISGMEKTAFSCSQTVNYPTLAPSPPYMLVWIVYITL